MRCRTGAGITRTFWIYKNSANSGVTIALTGSGTGAGISSGSDLSDSVSFLAGDIISIHTTATALTTSTGTIRWCIDAYSSTANQSLILGGSNSNLATSGNSYVSPSGKGLDTTSGNNVAGVMPTGGVLKNAYIYLGPSDPPGTGASYAATLYQNGNPAALTMSVSGNSAYTGSDTTHSVTVSPGDVLYWQVLASGTPTPRTVDISMEFDPTTNGESVHMYGSSVTDTNSAVRYNAVQSPNLASYQSTEASRQSLTLSAVWRKLYVNLLSAPGGTASFQVQLSTNSTAGSPSVTITGLANTGNDSNNVIATAGQTVAMKLTPAGTPTASTLSWGIVSYIPPAGTTNSNFLDFI